jgi:hypothetical protein
VSAPTEEQLRADVRRLDGEGLSRRAIADRLGISRYMVGRLLAESVADRPAEVADVADQVADRSATVADHAPDRPLPQRVAQPLDGFDVSQWPAVRRDLAVLAQTGRSAEALAHQAVTAMAHHYRRALDHGDIAAGQPFIVTQMTLRPIPVAGRAARAG